jgi:hypothetical protein
MFDKADKPKSKKDDKNNVTSIQMLAPAMSYQWRLRVLTDEEEIVTRQILRCEIDYVNMELRCEIVQAKSDPSLHAFLIDCAGSNLRIVIDTMSGHVVPNNVASTMEFEVKMTKHSYKLDYACSDDDLAKHRVTFSIQ